MKPKNEKPTALEWYKWNSWASSNGIGHDDRKFIFGQTPNDYVRAQVALRLIEYTRSLTVG